jgi:Helix-turn-helix domain
MPRTGRLDGLGYADQPEARPDGRLEIDADGPPMTTQDRTRRTTSGDRPDAPKPAPDAATSLPERLYEARERKGVDLYRAERDTKIRARYLDALERGDYKELPGAVYTKGFLRNYALYLGLDADEILEQWRRERGEPKEAQAPITVPRPLAAPRQGLTFSPFIIVLALMTLGVLAFGAYLGVQLLRFAKPPTISVTDPATAVVEVDDTATSYTLRGVTLPGATVNIDDGTPDRDPYQVTAESTGLWSSSVDLRRGRNQFDVNAIDPDTGKHSEDTIRLYITVPFPGVEGPGLTLDQPAEGATFENGAIPVQGSVTNAATVVVTAVYSGPVTPPAAGKPTPAPEKAPDPLPLTIGQDGAFAAPYELTAGHWALTVTATNADATKKTALTRNVTVAYHGVNVVVSVQNSRAWLKVWVDGKVSDVTGSAGRVFAPGKVLTFNAKESVEVRTGKSNATYFTVNGIDLGHLNDLGNPETWLFAPPDEPKQTDRR